MGRLSAVKSVVEFSGCWRTYGNFLASVWGRPKSHGTRLPCHIPRADEHILLFCKLCSDLIPLVPAWVPNFHTRIRRANRSWQYDSIRLWLKEHGSGMGLEDCIIFTVIITFLVEYLGASCAELGARTRIGVLGPRMHRAAVKATLAAVCRLRPAISTSHACLIVLDK
jgi:hypothetical protein